MRAPSEPTRPSPRRLRSDLAAPERASLSSVSPPPMLRFVTAAAKADLRRATEAAGVDMESLIAGQYALEQRAPFAILRAVADPAERDLPPLALKAVDSDGGIDVQAVDRRAYPLSEPVRRAPRSRGRQRGRVPRAKALSRPSSGPFPRPRSGGSLTASGRRSCRTRIRPRAGSRAGCPEPSGPRS